MTTQNEFCVFILTNGRPENVITYNTLLKLGYTGKIYLLVDNLDKTRDKYQSLYGDKVIIFDKLADTLDKGSNIVNHLVILYARNAAFNIARKLGIRYFIQLDDDYHRFRFRFNGTFNYILDGPNIKNLDRLFFYLLEFYVTSGATTLAISQGGDFIGGSENKRFASTIRLHRKAMNFFICSTDRPFQFLGLVNEDVTSYVRLGSIGLLFFTINQVCLEQKQTQSSSGGMTEQYLASGTYIKSFYSVMYQPSSVKVAIRCNRLHHVILWKNTVPKILSESLRKSSILERSKLQD